MCCFNFQLIYDFRDGGGTFGLISLHPDQISDEEIAKFRRIGVEIPSMMYVCVKRCLSTFYVHTNIHYLFCHYMQSELPYL